MEIETLQLLMNRHGMDDPIEEFHSLKVKCLLFPSRKDPPEEWSLKDISDTGLSFWCPDAGCWKEEQVLERCVLSFDDWIAYDGRVEVRSVRQMEPGTTVLAVSLMDDLLDMQALVRIRDIKEAHRRYQQGVDEAVARWSTPRYFEFKSRVADFALFLHEAKREMDAFEKHLSWDEIHGEAMSPARDALYSYLDGGFVRQWNEWLMDLNRLYVSDPGHGSKEVEAYTQGLLHRYVLEAPFMDRAFHKPLGYPGDFVLMTYIYGDRFEGRSLFGKAVHRGANHTVGAYAVRSRRRFLGDQLHALLARSYEKGVRPRVLSIAAGPAQELCDVLSTCDPTASFDAVLFEQDKQALAYSNRQAKAIIARRRLEGVRLLSLRDTIANLMKNEGFLKGNAPYDLIYAAGLYDYLKPEHAAFLTRRLWSVLAENGDLYIGNFSHKNTTRWGMEGMASWYLLHREPDEVAAFASMCPSDQPREVVHEATGVNLFLHLKRV